MKLQHIIYDVWLKDPEIIKYENPIREILVNAAIMGGATIICSEWHQFKPWGVTGFLLLQESHISIHTWPEENNFAAIDIFPCGSMDHDVIINSIRNELMPVEEKIYKIVRGQ